MAARRSGKYERQDRDVIPPVVGKKGKKPGKLRRQQEAVQAKTRLRQNRGPAGFGR